MGGFVLVHKSEGDGCAGTRTAAVASEIFSRMGITGACVLHDRNYELAVFPKRNTRELSVVEFDNGDFVCTCGTLIYKDSIGKAAAISFYQDYEPPFELHLRAMGHFAVILRKAGSTKIVLDSFGGYHVFCDTRMRIASSSFLAVAYTIDLLTLDAQGAYEYVFNGVVSGNATLFNEVILAPVNCAIAVRPRCLEITRRRVFVPNEGSDAAFEETVNRSIELLDRYFAPVASNFGDRVTCALSGGYDSRLIVAMLRRHGVQPQLYVYGPQDDCEIALAQAIARREGFRLEVVDKEKQCRWEPDEFAQIAHENFLAEDGYGWAGIFHNSAETKQRTWRVGGDAIALNGGGGEIWRNFFYLLDHPYTLRNLLWSFYGCFDPLTCTHVFDEEDYYRGLEVKLKALIGDAPELLPRPTIEWLYHNFRCRAWDGRVNTINNTFGYATLPFLERPITEQASTINIGWKNHGAYEAELIRRADPRLAACPSSYGHDFSRPPPPSRRLRDYGTYLRPAALRRYTYRLRYRFRQPPEWRGYLQSAYREAVLPRGPDTVRRLFRLERVRDPEQFTRILSLEYTLRQFGSRVRTGF